jgi:hypothetical protein
MAKKLADSHLAGQEITTNPMQQTQLQEHRVFSLEVVNIATAFL